MGNLNKLSPRVIENLSNDKCIHKTNLFNTFTAIMQLSFLTILLCVPTAKEELFNATCAALS